MTSPSRVVGRRDGTAGKASPPPDIEARRIERLLAVSTRPTASGM